MKYIHPERLQPAGHRGASLEGTPVAAVTAREMAEAAAVRAVAGVAGASPGDTAVVDALGMAHPVPAAADGRTAATAQEMAEAAAVHAMAGVAGALLADMIARGSVAGAEDVSVETLIVPCAGPGAVTAGTAIVEAACDAVATATPPFLLYGLVRDLPIGDSFHPLREHRPVWYETVATFENLPMAYRYLSRSGEPIRSRIGGSSLLYRIELPGDDTLDVATAY